MKILYETTITKKENQKVEEKTKDGILIKDELIDVPITVIFKKPNRLEIEEADSIFSIEFGKCVRNGYLTKPLIEKLYNEKDKSGILSEDYTAKYISLLEKFWHVQNDYTKIQIKSDKSNFDKEEMGRLAVEFTQIKNEIQTLESTRNSLFQHTAENKAQTKTILWLTLFLTHIKEGDNTPYLFFKGKSLEEKLDDYEKKVESEDDFTYQVIEKMMFVAGLYFLGKANSQADFEAIEKNIMENAPESQIDNEDKLQNNEDKLQDNETVKSESNEELPEKVKDKKKDKNIVKDTEKNTEKDAVKDALKESELPF